MTKNELALIADLLDAYADRLANDGCNDYLLPDTPENRELASVEDDDGPPHLYQGKVLAHNGIVTRKLAAKARADAALPF